MRVPLPEAEIIEGPGPGCGRSSEYHKRSRPQELRNWRQQASSCQTRTRVWCQLNAVLEFLGLVCRTCWKEPQFFEGNCIAYLNCRGSLTHLRVQ